MTEPVLEVSGLTAGYAGVPVVRDVDLTIGPGEVVALLGSNGAGKSTTLRAISGLVTPDAGRVSLDGRSLRGLRPHQIALRGLAFVPEDRALFADLTVDENIRLGRRTSGRRGGSDEVFALFPELGRLRKLRAGVLSGGEQQMLALARALAMTPTCLLVDEMSLGLAPVIVERLLPVVRRIADERGVGVLLVEQHVPVALGVADRAYVLAHGRVALSRPAHELLADPELLRASYLGSG